MPSVGPRVVSDQPVSTFSTGYSIKYQLVNVKAADLFPRLARVHTDVSVLNTELSQSTRSLKKGRRSKSPSARWSDLSKMARGDHAERRE